MKLFFAATLLITANLSSQSYLSENFDTPFSGSPAAPTGWTQTRVTLIGDGLPEPNGANGEKDWQQNVNTGVALWTIPSGFGVVPNAAVSGTGTLWMEDSYYGGTANALGSRRMESPIVNLAAATSPYVRLQYFYGALSSAFNVRVMASNDGGATWNSIMIIPPNAGATTFTSFTPYQRINVKVPAAYMVANAKFGVEMTNVFGTSNIWIDDFSVEEFTPTIITSAQSGNWSLTTTWVGGIVPTADNHVVIAVAHIVGVDVNIARCQDVSVNGTFQYAGTSTSQLTHILGNLTVNPGGTYNSFSGATGKRTYVGGSVTNNGAINFSVGAGNMVWVGGAPASISGAGVLTGGFISNLWHSNSGGVTYNMPVEVRNVLGLYVGPVNPNGMLTVGNSIVLAQTVERANGSLTVAPIWGGGVNRSINYITTSMNPLLLQTIMQGEEMRFSLGNRVAESTFLMSTHNNVQLTSPTLVGTTTTGALTLTRGIVITSNVNLFTLNIFTAGVVGTTPSVVTGTGVTATTHGSYFAGPMRINFPAAGTVTRNFALGQGTAFNTNLPSTNALRTVSFGNTPTVWGSQTITMEIVGAPSGACNLPVSLAMGTRAFQMNLNGGPGLSPTSTITLRYNNSTFGGSDQLVGDRGDVRIIQSPTLAGTWSERSLIVGAGPIPPNTVITHTSATVAPGPINNDMFFAWGSVGALVDMTPTGIAAPAPNTCFTTNETVSTTIFNNGIQAIDFSVNNVTITSNVTGPNPQTFAPVIVNSGILAAGASQNVVITTTYDMTLPGAYIFNATTACVADAMTFNDNMVPVMVTSQNPTVNAGSAVTYCTGSPVQLNAVPSITGNGPLQSLFNTTDFFIPDSPAPGIQSPITSTSPVNASQVISVVVDSLPHTWDSDLNFTLRAPDGSFIDLCSGNGGAGDNYYGMILSTTGPSVTTGVAPFTGTFTPEQPFSMLTGTANGTWNLEIVDLAGGDVGTLQRWTLNIPTPNSLVTVNWTPAAGLSSTTIVNPIASPLVTTTYTVTVTDVNGCTATDTVTVAVSAIPVVALGPDQTQCGGTILLDAQNPGNTYLWSTGATTQTITASTTGSYNVTVTNLSGCSNSDTINVTINSIPVQTLGPDQTQCGGTILLDAQNPGSNYLWSTSASTQTITVTLSGQYIVVVTSPQGCSNSDTVNITINAVPVVVLGNDTAFCAGGSVLLDALNVGSAYLWSTGATTQTITANSSGAYNVVVTNPAGCTNADTIQILVNALPVVSLGNDTTMCSNSYVLDAQNPGSLYLWSTSASTQMITINISGSYNVTVTDGNGCSNSDTISVTLNVPPVQPFGNDTTLCADSLILNALNVGSTYLWSTSATTQTITVMTSGTYMVDITTPGGCMISDTIDVVLNPVPVADAGDDTTICLGNSVTLIGNPGYTSYSWTFNSVVVNSQVLTIAPTDTTMFILTVTNSFGCTDTDTMFIYVLPQPAAVFTYTTLDGVTYNFIDQSTGAQPMTYTWDFGDGSPFSTQQNPTHTYTTNGTYLVILTIQTPCGLDQYSLVITVTNVGLGEYATSVNLNVYPNPGSGIFQISIPGSGAGKFEFAVSDISGKILYQEEVISSKNDLSHQLDLTEFANGVYYLRVMTEGEFAVKKLILQK